MGFDVILLILILELKVHKEGKKCPKLKWFNSDTNQRFIFFIRIYFACRPGFLWFQKVPKCVNSEEIYTAQMFHEMLPKLSSFPERPITSQMVKSQQDQTDAAEAQNFRQYKSSGRSHQSKAVKR